MQPVKLSIRIDLPKGERFGPGKAALLRALIETGSIRSAAEQLKMSYPRALKLIDQMNASFTEPLIETKQGGPKGGGASATALGRQILDYYDGLCTASEEANAELIAKMIEHIAE